MIIMIILYMQSNGWYYSVHVHVFFSSQSEGIHIIKNNINKAFDDKIVVCSLSFPIQLTFLSPPLPYNGFSCRLNPHDVSTHLFLCVTRNLLVTWFLHLNNMKLRKTERKIRIMATILMISPQFYCTRYFFLVSSCLVSFFLVLVYF